MTKQTDGPVGLNTRFEGIYARAGVVSLELVEFVRPVRLTFRAHAKIVAFDDQIVLAAEGSETRLAARLVARPRGFMRLFTPVMAKTMRRRFEENWPHLKRALEKRGTP